MLFKGLHLAKIVFIMLLSLLIFDQAWAQSGTIKGVVLDKATGEPLIGANVVILNTSLGAATDIDGKFVMYNIPPRKWSLKISYIGYEPVTEEIEVVAGETIQKKFMLVAIGVIGDEYVVYGQMKGQQSAINQQLTSNTIKNVVSADRIRELPDESAAAAISRLPGVSLMDGDKVVIRGIQSKQNVILMNGIQLPSTDMNDRSVNLGFISSNMLSGIEVIKVLTPDMDANAVGGVVNLRLMEAPENFRFSTLMQGTYNAQNKLGVNENYKFWLSTSNRYFDNKFGIFVQGYADRTNEGNNRANANFVVAFPDGFPFGRFPTVLNSVNFVDEENIISNQGGSIMLDLVFPNGKVIIQNSLSQMENDLANYSTNIDVTLNNQVVWSLNRDKFSKKLITNSIFTEYNFGKVKTEFSLSHSYSDKKTILRYADPGQGNGFVGTNVFKSNITGDDTSWSIARYQGTLEDVMRMQTDPNFPIKIKEDVWRTSAWDGWATLHWENFKHRLFTIKLDFSFPLTLTANITSNFKFGGKIDRNLRTNDFGKAYRRTGDAFMFIAVQDFIPGKILDPVVNKFIFEDAADYNYKRGGYFFDGDYRIDHIVDKNLMDLFYPKARSGWPKQYHRSDSERNDFDGSETYMAGYLMGEFKIGPKFNVLTGARYEKFNMKYNAKTVYVTHPVDGDCNTYDLPRNHTDRNDINWFPNLQLKYKVNDWMEVRGAYSKSITRPDFLAIIPNLFSNPGISGQLGNPDLLPTKVTNYDVSVYLYENSIGLFTVTGFYKKLQDVFFQSNIKFQNLSYWNVPFPDTTGWRQILGPTAPLPTIRDDITVFINNPYPGYVRGFEIDWQTNFWYLPKPFNGLVLNINYTRTWSSIEYLRIDNEKRITKDTAYIIQYNPRTGRTDTVIKIVDKDYYVTTSMSYKGKLQNQGDHTLNITLGFDYKGFSGRISYNLQDAVNSYIGTRPEDDQFTGRINRWDFSLQQKILGENLSIGFNGVNIFRAPLKIYKETPRAIGAQGTDGATEVRKYVTTMIYSPSFYEIVLRYNL